MLQFVSRTLSSFESGSLKVPVDSVFPLEQAQAAHTRMRENKNIGKLILSVE